MLPEGRGERAKFSVPFRGRVVGGGVELLGKRDGYSWVGGPGKPKDRAAQRQRERERERERGRERERDSTS